MLHAHSPSNEHAVLTIGAVIKTTRLAFGLTQRELAERVGCTQASIGHYERGICVPRTRHAKSLELALGIPGLASRCLPRLTKVRQDLEGSPASSTRTSFRDRVKMERLRLGMTQADLARRVGCSATTICHLETGQRHSTAGVARAVAQVLALEGEIGKWARPLDVDGVSELRRRRNRLGLTLANVSSAVGCSLGHLGALECGKPSSDQLRQDIADYLREQEQDLA